MSVIRRQKRRTRLKRVKSFNHPQRLVPQRLVPYGVRSAQKRAFHISVGQAMVRALSRPLFPAEFVGQMRRLVADIQEGARVDYARTKAALQNLPTGQTFYLEYEKAS